MKLDIQNMWMKVAILVVTFLICIPCSAKRELKQVLDIPVSYENTKNNADQLVECSDYLVKKQSKNNQTDHATFNPIITSISNLHLFCEPLLKGLVIDEIERLEIIYPIPIYIVHEQYRI